MERSLEFFSKINVNISQVLSKMSKYLPSYFFDYKRLNTAEFYIGDNSESNWFLLPEPFKIWNVIEFRNGTQDKSDLQDVTINNEQVDFIPETIVDKFVFYHYGDGFVIRRQDVPITLKIEWYGIDKKYENMDQLVAMEFRNLMMNLRLKNQEGIFDGIKRIKELFNNIPMQNIEKKNAVVHQIFEGDEWVF
jgi:hypothetical protein